MTAADSSESDGGGTRSAGSTARSVSAAHINAKNRGDWLLVFGSLRPCSSECGNAQHRFLRPGIGYRSQVLLPGIGYRVLGTGRGTGHLRPGTRAKAGERTVAGVQTQAAQGVGNEKVARRGMRAVTTAASVN